MDDKDYKYTDSQLPGQTETRRSIFDFSSVEDLRQPDDNQDSDPVKTQPTILFKESYIAHAPSRHSFTLNSRYTYFGGLRTSSRDMSGSVEDLAGCTRRKERHLSLGNFSKSSPDLLSYQFSRGDADTNQQTQEEFVMNIDLESNFENENKHENENGGMELENDTIRTQKEHEARSHMCLTTFQNAKRDISFAGEEEEDNETASLIFEEFADVKEANTHVQYPGTIKETSEINEEKRNAFDKGWKTILYSGKAELKRSLQSLSSLKQDMNSREVQNIETFENVDTVMSQQDEVSLEEVRELVNGEGFDKGVKKKDETAEMMRETQLKVSAKSEKETFTLNNEENLGFRVSDAADNMQSFQIIEPILETLRSEKYTTDGVVNTSHATTTREETANEIVEKQVALECVSDNEHSSTSELTGVHEHFHINYHETTTTEIQENKGSLNTNDNVELPGNNSHVNATNSKEMVDNEEYSSHSCHISPITLRVVSNSTVRDEHSAGQNTNADERECKNTAVRVSGIRQSSICVREEYQRDDYLHQFLPDSKVETYETNSNWISDDIDQDEATQIESPQEKTDNSLLNNMMGMFCLLGLKDSPDGGFYSNGHGILRPAMDPINLEQEICVNAEIPEEMKEEDEDLHGNIETELFTPTENEALPEENDTVFDINWEQKRAQDAELGTDNNATKTQLMMDDESPTIIEEKNSDVLCGHETLFEEKSSICHKEFLLNQETDTALYVSDIQNGKDENLVEYQKTKEYTNEGTILQITSTSELLLQMPGYSGENSEIIVLQQTTEEMVEQDMRENGKTDYFRDDKEPTKSSKEKEFETTTEGISTENQRGLENTTTATILEINTNKWSYAYIIPLRSMNAHHPKKLSGGFNVLVLDKQLIPTSPERTSTVITLNLLPHKTAEDYHLWQSRELSEAEIQVNEKLPFLRACESYLDVLEQDGNEYVVWNNIDEENDSTRNAEGKLEITSKTDPDTQTSQLDHNDGNHGIFTSIRDITTTESEERFLSNPITEEQNSKNPRMERFLETDLKKSVHKVDFKAITDKRLYEHLLCFEADELVDERITKDENVQQRQLFSELDEILLPGNEIRETICKEKSEGFQCDFLSKLDEFVVLEDTREKETEELKNEENNNVILSRVDEQVYSSEFDTGFGMTDKTQTLEELYLLQSKNEIPEVIEKTERKRDVENTDLSQLHEVFEPDYIREIISETRKVQTIKQDYFSEIHKYFNSIEDRQHLPAEKTEPEVVHIEEKEDSYDEKEKIWEITVNERELLPLEKEMRTVASVGLSDTNGDQPIFVISHLSFSTNPCVDEDEADDSDDDEQGDDDFDDNDDDDDDNDDDDDDSDDDNDDSDDDEQDDVDDNDDDNDDDEQRDNGVDDNDEISVDDGSLMQYAASPIQDDLSSIASNYDASAESSSEMDSLLDDVIEHLPWDSLVSNSNPNVEESNCQVLRASYSSIQPAVVYQVESEVSAIDGKNICDKETHPASHHSLEQPEISEILTTMSYPKEAQPNEDKLNINTETRPGEKQYRTTMDIKQNQNEVNSSYMLFQRFGKQESPRTHFELHYDMDKWKVGKQLTSLVDLEKTFVVSYATIEHVNPPSTTTLEYLPAIEEDSSDDDVCEIQATQIMFSESLPSPPPSPPVRPHSPTSPPLPIPPSPPPSPSSPLPIPLSPPPSPSSPHSSPLPQLTRATTKADELDNEEREINLYAVKNSPEISTQEHVFPSPTEYTEPGETHHHSPESRIANEDITTAYKLNVTHIQEPAPAIEGRQPVWSFAQCVFLTDGQSKTFFKVIDDRKEPFKSSTFMYRGERIKVSRGIRVFKNPFESSNQDTGDEKNRIHDDYEGYQIMDIKDEEDYIGYSEIWDEGNQMTVNNEMTEDMDETITRTATGYEMATEQDLFQEERNCSWYLKLHGSHGACEVSSNNYDAIAIDDDNTLLGSVGFISGLHRWVIQGLGIFCAVGVCYSGEDARSWYKGGKWVWTTDGLMYSEPTGIARSEFGQWRNEDVLEITLDCEKQQLTIVNTRTKVEASLYGFQREVYPYFNIYKGSCIRLLETS